MAAQATISEVGVNLALAVVASSAAPLLLLDGEFTVVGASASFCKAFQLEEADVLDRPVFDLGVGEWNARKLHSLLEATASGQADIAAYEIDLVRPGLGPRRLVLGARKLEYCDPVNVRIVLTVSDVTEARLSDKIKDDLLREKNLMLQEVQHRVANSLQIIASVLMQSARKVQSEETRGHLRDAHNRVMSIAALQRQLAESSLGQVEITPYFRLLCKSLSASMIHDPEQITLGVDGDDSKVAADTSVSLGLVVTELVINALKHAFPDHRAGGIQVGYASEDDDWTLTVTDDGVGIPTDAEAITPGLGTNIVEALARHLDAEVTVADAEPGTSVSLVHTSDAQAHKSRPMAPAV